MLHNQGWFGDEGLPSVYVGFNHPQKLFLMSDRHAEAVSEKTQASDLDKLRTMSL